MTSRTQPLPSGAQFILLSTAFLSNSWVTGEMMDKRIMKTSRFYLTLGGMDFKHCSLSLNIFAYYLTPKSFLLLILPF